MGRGEVHIGFWWRNLKERDHLEDLGVDEIVILKMYLKKWGGGMVWIDMARNRIKWQALVNVVTNVRVT
jgi:hypothetical protein